MLPVRSVLIEQISPENAKKWSNLSSFWKPEVCCQTVLPDSSVLKGQKSVENAKIEKFEMRHFE